METLLGKRDDLVRLLFRISRMNAPSAASPPRPLLLVADDDHDSADQLAQLLQTALQCEVVTAYDGDDALALARSPVAVILDLEMPVLSGAEVAR